jgi:hypothetical protein
MPILSGGRVVEGLERYPKQKLRRFLDFHKSNKEVYSRFKELAFEMREAGRTKFSARTIVEILRWNHNLKTSGKDFKISNEYSPLYARLFIHQFPEFKNFFDFR